MPIFQYVAADQTGAQTQGSYEAANEEQALAQLAQYGLTVTQLVPTQAAPEVHTPTQPQKKQNKNKRNLGVPGMSYEADIFSCSLIGVTILYYLFIYIFGLLEEPYFTKYCDWRYCGCNATFTRMDCYD